MNLLITGANGQLGRELCRQLQNGGSALGPVPRALQKAHTTGVDIEDGDLTSLAETRRLIAMHKPDVVINCAAFTAVDAAEANETKAFAVNAIAPRNLAMACEEAGAKLIHLSTDYVFSGKGTRPATEADLPAPQSAYGRTKLAGENYVQQFCSKWFIVRTAWLYGKFGPNFVKTMVRLGAEKDELDVVADQVGNPTNAEDLAHHLLKLAPTEEYGLYHCTGGGVCSWHQFASEIIRLAGGKARVNPCTTEEYAALVPNQASRPAYSALAHTMLQATVGDDMRPWKEALEHYFATPEEN